MTSPKAIETHYNGNFYRSRLEARWCVFFKNLKIEYHYEPEGFDLGKNGRYLPDFWLPSIPTWVEVKGKPLTTREINKAVALSSETRHTVLILSTIPNPQWCSTANCYIVSEKETLWLYAGREFDNWPTGHKDTFWAWESAFDEFCLPDLLSQHGYKDRLPSEYTSSPARKLLIEIDKEYYHKRYGKKHPKWNGARHTKCTWDLTKDDKPCLNWGEYMLIPSVIVNAYTAARQARFEHGQVGAPSEWNQVHK